MDKIFGAAHFTIHPGKAQLFRERAAECLGAARLNLAGTAAYEWFMTPAGERCTVIECYDGMAGLGTHIQQVGKIVGALRELAVSDVILFGDVSPDVQARVAKLNTRFFGNRLFGRLNAPAAPDGSIGAAGVYALARFKPQAERTARFKELAAECFSIASGEPGTVGYEWFVNSDETEFATLDIYRDLASLQVHGGNVGKLMREILTIARRDVEVFGGLDAATQAAFAARGMTFVGPRLQGVL